MMLIFFVKVNLKKVFSAFSAFSRHFRRIFAAGGAKVPTQEKKEIWRRYFRRWGGQGAHTRKKKSEEGMIYQLIAEGWCYYDQRDKTRIKA